MAERRMFAKSIVTSDAFMDMPMSTQCLYFHFAMRADDDGFLNNPKTVQRMVGATDDDLKILITKRFIIAFESGVIVIKHWKINNYIRSDRYKKTNYKDELLLLDVKENGAYTEKKQLGIPECESWYTNGIPSIGKDSIGKISISQVYQDSISNNSNLTNKPKSICDGLTDDQFDLLDNTYEDFLDLINLIDERLRPSGADGISDPYAYIIRVARDERWATK